MALTLVTSDLIGGLDYSKLTGTVPTWNQNTTGSAATLTTARTIGGVSFNGSAAINLPGVNAAGNQNTSGTAAGLSATLAVGSGGTGVTSITALKNVLDDETWTFANNITATGTLTVNGTGNSAFNGDLYIVGKKLDISAPSGGNAYVKFSDTNSSAKIWRVGTSLSSRGVFNIYNQTDDSFPFNILADGKVGIGTTSPAVPLHVNGDTRISGEFSVFPKQIIGSYASSDAGTAAEPSYAFYANTAMGMYPAGTNTLGFSTSGTSCLTISSAGLATFKSTYISASDHGGELTVGGGSTDFGIAMKFNQSGATSGTIYCSPGYTNAGTTLKLGTGTNTDQLVLLGTGVSTFANGTSYELLELKTSRTDANYGIKLYHSDSTLYGYLGGTGSSVLSGASTGDLVIRGQGEVIIASGGNNRRLTVASGGNVGIGTTSPSSTLHVSGNIKVDASATANNPLVVVSDNGGGLITFTRGSAFTQMYMSSTTSGNQFYVASQGSGGVVLATGGTSWGNGSDARLKKNFETTQGLSEVLQIEPIKYHLKTQDNSETKKLGFKAQNLQTVIPEMILDMDEEDPEDGSKYLGIIPDYLFPVLVKAIQEQQTIIENLKLRIETLEG